MPGRIDIIQAKNTAPVPDPVWAKPNLLSSRPSRRSTRVIPFCLKSARLRAGTVIGNTCPSWLIRRLIFDEHPPQSQKYSSRPLPERHFWSASSRNNSPSRRWRNGAEQKGLLHLLSIVRHCQNRSREVMKLAVLGFSFKKSDRKFLCQPKTGSSADALPHRYFANVGSV